MSRVIKFRAWDDIRKRMMTSAKWVEFRFNSKGKLDAVNFNPKGGLQNLDLMQFTGLTDKNGVDIYEGDVIKQSGVDVPVIWNDEWGCWELQFSILSAYDGELMNLDFSDLCDRAEVIGNIHENPELIK